MPRKSAKPAPTATAKVSNNGASDNVPTYPIGSVDNALRLLRLFGEHRSIRIAEASREIGVARSTAHRMMQMLQYHGFVRQDTESKAYLAGDELIRIGLSVVRLLDLRTLAHPVMESLVRELQETVHVVERRDSDVFFLESVESPRNLRAGSRAGMLLPAFCTATGKVLLADLAPEVLRELYPKRTFAGLTEKTQTSREDLEKELELVRERGYATNFGESEIDIAAIAVPVRDRRGTVRAGLAVSAPVTRVEPGDVPQIADSLKAGAARLEAALP
jgi:DNA-binding IclR family transcriptional regulator